MLQRTIFSMAAAAALAPSLIMLHAQSPIEPTAYTVKARYQITGAALRITYRLGSKVLVDQTPSPGIPPEAVPAARTRTLYNLDTGQSLTWKPDNIAESCTYDSFQGDAWLDPFSGAADFAMPDVTRLGSETIQGVPAVILVSRVKPGFTLWVDPKTGLMLKARFKPPSSDKAITYFEVTEVHLEPPPAALFDVPARCTPNRDIPKSKPTPN